MDLPVLLPPQPTPHPEVAGGIVLKPGPDHGALLLKSCQWHPVPASQGRRLRLASRSSIWLQMQGAGEGEEMSYRPS